MVQEPKDTLGVMSIEVAFARKLGGNDKLQRDRAMRNVSKWLRSETCRGRKFTQKQLILIWKGLHYCMWMCDKPLVQEELADKIVGLSSCFEENRTSRLNFYDTFFQTMAREYYRIDRLRLDKFLMLTRRMFRDLLNYIRKEKWTSEAISQIMTRLRKNVLSGNDHSCSEGLQAFVVELFLQELARNFQEHPEDVTDDITSIYRIFSDILKTATTPFLRTLHTKYIFEDLLKYPDILKRVNREVVSTYAIELGKEENCPAKNRRALYHVYSLFHAKLSKKRLISESSDVKDINEKESTNVYKKQTSGN